MLWSSGRQSRFLADISPKFFAAALMKSKNPIFLEAVNLNESGQIDTKGIKSVVNDYEKFIDQHVFAVQEGVFDKQEDMVSLKDGFQKLADWVTAYYKG